KLDFHFIRSPGRSLPVYLREGSSSGRNRRGNPHLFHGLANLASDIVSRLLKTFGKGANYSSKPARLLVSIVTVVTDELV
ncbi:MAG: hypothetical protein MUC83_18655, partial [Pirellula sp.]|nr:hypothetical protein [Pirellula sp.]